MHTEEYAKMRALEDRYWWFVSRRRLARALLSRHAPAAKAVLDLGCGTGALLSEFEPGFQATGVDFSEAAVSLCRERNLVRIVRGDAEHLPFASTTFDAVVSLDTLEHVAQDATALSEVARVLKPGGILVVNVPAFRWLWGPHDVALMHYRRYTRTQLRDALTAEGLRIEALSYSVFFLFPIVVLVRLLERARSGPAEVKLPKVPGFLNRALVILQDVETRVLLQIPLPWGSSVVAVARKEG